MSFFQKLSNALSRFMYGRNGSDQLGWASIILLLVLNTVNLFLRSSSSDTVYMLLTTADLVLMVWILFRMFSRNLPKRRRENAWFLAKIVNPVKNRRMRSMDKQHKYFTCPNCRTVWQHHHHLSQVWRLHPRQELNQKHQAPAYEAGASYFFLLQTDVLSGTMKAETSGKEWAPCPGIIKPISPLT